MPDETPHSINDIIRSTPLRGESGKHLQKRLLQSLASGASDTHMLVARAIFSTADQLEEPDKSLLLDQIFFCLARALEDYGMLCLMSWDDTRTPMEIYLNIERPEIRAFYTRCRRNTLTDEQLLRVAATAPAAMLGKIPLFAKLIQPGMALALDLAAKKSREALTRMGRLYHATLDDADPQLGPWQIAFAKSPLGLKLLVDREKPGAEILMGTEEAPDSANPGKTIPNAFSARVSFEEGWTERVLHELETVCEEIKLRAEIKLALMEGPEAWMKRLYEQNKEAADAAVAAESAARAEAQANANAALAAAQAAAQEAKARMEELSKAQAAAAEAAALAAKAAAQAAALGKAAPPPPAAPAGKPASAAEAEPKPSGPIEQATGQGEDEHKFDAPTTAIQGEVKQVGGIKIVHSQSKKE